MCLVENSSTEVTGSSEVPRFVGKIFLGSSAAVFLLKNCVGRCQSEQDTKYECYTIFQTAFF